MGMTFGMNIAMPSEYGEREQHHIYGAEIAKQLLTELNYPKERIEQVKKCVLNHRGSKDRPRNTIEEQCVADADVARYSVLNGNEKLFTTKYKTYLPTEEELKAEIESQKAIFEIQQLEKKENNIVTENK